MKQLTGNTEVKGGFYINRNEWDIVVVPGEKGILKGETSDRFVRLPALALFLVAPLLGGLFVMFLPFIGFALLFEEIGRRTMAAARRLGAGAAGVVAPAWTPGEAHLTGKGKENPTDVAPEAKDEKESLKAIVDEIEEKKNS